MSDREFRDEINRVIVEASGHVSDSRRFVQFLYLLMRDHVAIGCVGDALRYTFFPEDRPTSAVVLLALAQNPDVYVAAKRLVDAPTERHAEFLVRLSHAVGVYVNQKNKYALPEALAKTLLETDSQDGQASCYSNGWLARYAQFVVDVLADPNPLKAPK